MQHHETSKFNRVEFALECIALGGWVVVGLIAIAAHLIVWWLS